MWWFIIIITSYLIKVLINMNIPMSKWGKDDLRGDPCGYWWSLGQMMPPSVAACGFLPFP